MATKKTNGESRIKTRITPMLWFDDEAEDAAQFYTSIFPNSRITQVSHYGEGAPKPAGSVLVVAFELDGQPFSALNGGPQFKFSEAISLVVNCDGQRELDRLWDRLLEGGGHAQACGWLKDRYGLSWQVVPKQAIEMLSDPDPARARRAFGAVMKMVKLDLAEIRRAYEAR
jgi:predicted 3-demethylubiquinone-9 3-methyltransferase (glyoxalase superfamily)